MEYKEYAKQLVDEREGIIAAYGYGSAFNHQSGYTAKTAKSMDMIFAVENIKQWNKRNFILHDNDYTSYTKAIFKITPKKLLTLETPIIYNIIRGKNGINYKYGLVEKESLLNDLYTFEHMYVCGRLQKPLYEIKGNNDINRAIDYNRHVALLVSLIILDKFRMPLTELLEMICSLSYNGDVRTLFAENPNKIKNIVKGSLDDLKNIYCHNDYVRLEGDIVNINLNKAYLDYYTLPSIFSNCFSARFEASQKLQRKIRLMNLKESMIHPVKQFYVTGFSNSKNYMQEKMKKKSLK